MGLSNSFQEEKEVGLLKPPFGGDSEAKENPDTVESCCMNKVFAKKEPVNVAG